MNTIKKKAPRVVVFCNGRSGSHLLGSFLNQHPELHFDFEKFGNVVKDQNTTNLPFYFSKYLPAQYLNWRISKAKKPGYGLSFHLYMYQFTRFRISDFHARGFKIIRLNRDDALQQMLSHKVAAFRNNWHRNENWQRQDVNQDKNLKSNMKLDLKEDILALKNFIALQKDLDREVEPFPHLRLSYGRDLESEGRHQETMDRVFKYLNLEPFTLRASPFKKVYRQPYSSMFENYDDFVHHAKSEGLIDENT
jgi:hypothetical protein